MSKSKLAKNISAMSIAVFISRILGLLRDVLFAFLFGTSRFSDAFRFAYQIPNLLRKLFGEGALAAAFIPIYKDIGVKKDKKEQILFALEVLSILTL
jgi:putative peptidoglycan lipid II flippase